MQFIGNTFTWSNNRVPCKLDRVLVNQGWAASGFAHFLPAGFISDHSPCVVTLLDQHYRKKAQFRFFNVWAEHSDFLSTVSAGWEQRFSGIAQFKLCKKLATSKGKLHALNRKHFSHISERAQGAKEELEQAERQLQLASSNAEFLAQVVSKRQAAHRICEAERSFLQQQAKCTYLRNCDKGTKFFHALVKRKRKKNFIAAITNSDGTVSTSLEQVTMGFLNFYKELLGTAVNLEKVDPTIFSFGPSISEEQNQDLGRDFTDVEIRAALDGIGNNESPGPDGFSTLFFKKAWSIVGESVFDVVKEFFRNGQLLKQINHAVIALIPKSINTSTVGDYRPIGCCNVVYKLIAKVLSARIEPCLSSIIDRAQAAFVPGRSMTDNILLMQELLRGYNRKRSSPRCIIKIDLRKAYDSMSWDF